MLNEFHLGASEAVWVWLFPVTFLAHIVEEYCGGEGYSQYLSRERGVDLPPRRFLVLTGIGLTLMVAGVLLAQRLGCPELLLVCLGTVVLVNGLSHTINTAVTGAYNPGLITGMLLWIPLGSVTLLHLIGSMHTGRYLSGVGVGIAIHAVVSLLALTGVKLFWSGRV